MRESVSEVSGRLALRRRPLEVLRARPVLHGRRRRRSRAVSAISATALREVEDARTDRRQRPVLSLHAAQSVRARSPKGSARRICSKGDGWRRIVIEKPFGHDLASARELNDDCRSVFEESEIYRIDHYLGKETVQNILAFRFGNGIFEPLWNRRYIDHVQITAAESIGVEGRGAYYQEAGALRDMIQNHLLQVMATVAMEPSATFQSDAVRDERAKLLRSIRIMKPEEVPHNAVAGQYGPGRVGGEEVPGFRQEKGVDPEFADRHLCGRHLLRR